MSTLLHTRRRHAPTEVASNLTSMIDVVFLLVVFFILVSQVVSREAEPLDLPKVPDAAAAVAGEDPRLVVNVLSDTSQPGVGLRAMVLGQPFSLDSDGCQALSNRVAVDLEQRPDLAIHLRADREVHFEWIHPVLEALRAASARVDGAEAKVHLVLLEPAS